MIVCCLSVSRYLEEMLLHAGLFDDNPHTRADIWRYYRLRVLRISTDLNLGCGLWDIPEGADYLEKNVPMDKGTAEEDAWMYLATPGLGLSYGIGKAQIMRFLALARQHHDDSGHEGMPQLHWSRPCNISHMLHLCFLHKCKQLSILT